MSLWRREHDNTDNHKEAEAALERERRARSEIETKGVELEAKRTVARVISDGLVKHLQENNFSGMLRRALEAQGERH